MSRNVSIKYAVDWTTILLYVILVLMGWISIYGASYNFDQSSILDFSQRAGKQFMWIISGFTLAGILLLLDSKVFSFFSYFLYGATLLLLVVTIFIAPDVKGSRSWLVMGPISFQPAELAKIATALALSKYMSSYNFKLRSWRDLIPISTFIGVPFLLIILQKETGTALVFLAFLLMFYREGMSGLILLTGSFAVLLFILVIRFSTSTILNEQGTLGMQLAMSSILLVQLIYAFFYNRHRLEALILFAISGIVVGTSILLNIWFKINFDTIAIIIVLISSIYWIIVEVFRRYKKYWLLIALSLGSVAFSYSSYYLFENILGQHQQVRIKVLLNMENDLSGAGYNVNQSKIAIGSGGFLGKGFLNGTQTKLKYVPEQDTDFIFCTVGEEHGFLGSTVVLALFWVLLIRLLKIAERQRDSFNRIYTYCVASILFFHLMINIGMVLGIMPVIGIPLPFFSYGGSSLWGFTVLLFIALRLDATRLERMR